MVVCIGNVGSISISIFPKTHIDVLKNLLECKTIVESFQGQIQRKKSTKKLNLEHDS